MIRKKLIEPVTVQGKNIFRQHSSITFLPAGKPGWYLRTLAGDIPIDHRIARHREARIQLSHGGISPNIWEHIGPLRFTGVDEAIVIPHNNWPPFLGGMRGYLPEFLKSGKTVEDGILPTISPLQYMRHESHNHLHAATEIIPANKLQLRIRARWGNLPWYDECLTIEELSADYWESIWDAKPQGWLKGRNIFFSAGIRLLKTVSKQDVAWMENFTSPEEIARQWGLHRVQDILGCLSLCSHTALPVMRFDSYCAGHKEDLAVVKKCF